MKTSDFDYILPPDRIAQMPTEPRDHSKLLVVDRASGALTHKHFYDIGAFLRPGDLLIVNESKVFKARLQGQTPSAPPSLGGDSQKSSPYEGEVGGVEIFLLRADGPHWIALAKPGKKLYTESSVTFKDGTDCRVIEKRDDGTVLLDFGKSPEEVLAWTDQMGEVPLPPYIRRVAHNAKRETSDTNDTRYTLHDSRYQTVYAKKVGSVAAPTAGFHFTPELIEKLKLNGVRFASITLHVGLGTFRPMKTETIEEHQMHEEWVDVPDETLVAIEETKKNGGRVIAVGTTTVRALESMERHPPTPEHPLGLRRTRGFTSIFIMPGYHFKIIDGLITNFHLPKSTLLVLVSTFAGQELIKRAYSAAIENGYRFYSFGDAMLIL